jgi:molybdopterin biosynthesis enzyme
MIAEGEPFHERLIRALDEAFERCQQHRQPVTKTQQDDITACLFSVLADDVMASSRHVQRLS